MGYSKFREKWFGRPDPRTPVTPEAIEHIEDGVARAHEAIDGRLGETALNATYTRRETAPVMPLVAISTPGESTTHSPGVDWPVNHLAPLLGVPVVNQGVSGQGAADILTRVGLLRPQVAVSGGAIPASGPVAVTSIDPATGWRINGTGSFAFTGSINGVEGNLSHDTQANTWTFTRTTAGSAVPVAPGTEFIRKESLTTPFNRLVIGTGRNNVTDGSLPAVRDLLRLGVGNIRTQVKKYLIWGVINGTDEPRGHARHTAITAYNTALAADHGERFYDVRRDFIDRGLTLAGIAPTSQDTTNIGNDCPPPSLMADAIHPNAAGYKVLATLIAEKLLALGWVSKLNYPVSGTVLASDSFNRADTAAGTLGIADAAFGGATGLVWETDSQLQVVDNALGATTLSANRAARFPIARPDAYIEVTSKVFANNEGVVGRFVDANNYYYVATGTGTSGAGIFKRVAGTGTAIATASVQTAPQPGDKYGLEIIGTRLRMFRNGIVVAETTDAAIADGKWGPRSPFNVATFRQDDATLFDKAPYAV
ncbi:hypothetical protein GS479_01335 [Rhodococcus hoagii]|nr:hypothetical protein [Prescottella equi]